MVSDVARKTDFRGSDLRSRTDVVRWLRDQGDDVYDKTGLVASRMRSELGKGRALTQLLAEMEKDGMIEREVAGRRTMRVRLLDDWGLLEGDTVAPSRPTPRLQVVESDVQDDQDVQVPDGVDYDLLAQSLLAVVVQRASSTAEAAEAAKLRAEVRELRGLQRDLEKSQSELRRAKDDRTAALAERDQLAEQVRVLQHNLEQVQKELRRKPRGGVSIQDRLSDEERSMLRNLMTALPETAQSKPRGTAKRR